MIERFLMLRQGLLYLSGAKWARNVATNWGLAKKVARRFVAGEQLDEAIAATKVLNTQGIGATLDYLGESVEKEEDTREVVQTYLTLVDRISAEKLDSSLSLKLTHLGFDIREELAVNNLREILQAAEKHNIQVTIDMENTPYTEATIRIYRTMRDEYGFENVGTVIQAYLRRTEKDMQELAQENSHIRICKGAYLEAPEHAFPEKSDVDANYLKVVEQYLKGGDAYLAIATHDENMVQGALQTIEQHKIPKTRYEFQMLYGIRSQRQLELAQTGHTMRVYVPFGAAWYPYFVRRLAERPANLWFFIKGFFS
jgi:proline dehydrogenase